jgi:hypothetical protein
MKRARTFVAILIVSSGWVAACGSDATTPTSHDGGTDASLDVGPDTYKPIADAAPGPDSADSAIPPKPCDPNNDTCGVAKKCCQIAGKGADGGANFVCVLLKPPDNICPPVM